MRSRYGIRKGNGNVEELCQRESVLGQKLRQCLTVDELHRDEVNAFCFFDGEDLNNVGVVESGDGLGFSFEPRPALFALG